VTAGRRGIRLQRLMAVVRSLDYLTISADSHEVMRIGGTNRSMESAVEAYTTLAPPMGAIHLVFFELTPQEVEAIAVARADHGIDLQFSPLVLSPEAMLMRGMSRPGYLDQLRRDVEILAGARCVNEEFIAMFDGYCALVEGATPNRACRATRLYVSATGDIRLCLDSRSVEISVFRSRKEIEEYFSSNDLNMPLTCPECFTLCR
jgi:hypothetical protein